jgi:Secretion system C-terminal sorting domain
MKLKLPFLLLSLLFSHSATPAQTATFQFTNLGSIPEVDAALDYVGLVWSNHLNSTTPIKVNTYYSAIGAGTTLGVTIPNGRRDFSTAAFDSVWYPSCLANAMEGVELNPGEADMDIIINSSVNWYFGTDGNPGPGQYDFITVLMHEVGHGLGFLSLAKYETGTGSFGYITLADISPFVTSFPFPDLQGKYSIFSHYMETSAGLEIDDTVNFANPSVALGTVLTSNDIFFNAPLAVAANGGNRVPIFCPGTWASGSSLEHVNENSYPPSNDNALMTPYVNDQEVHHFPGMLTLSILQDIGWIVNFAAETSRPAFAFGMKVYPNPATSQATVLLEHPLDDCRLEVSDISGAVIQSTELSRETAMVDLSSFPNGMYVVKIFSGNELKAVEKLIRQ